MINKNHFVVFLVLIFGLTACRTISFENEVVQEVVYQKFSGERAWKDVDYQVSLGLRIPGSQAHTQSINWIEERLRGLNWSVEIQEADVAVGQDIRKIQNVVAKSGSGEPWLILGAHYDSRLYADRDPDPTLRNQPVPGANDGASGVAVLLEMGRILPEYLHFPTTDHTLKAQQIWLVFFDAEDNGQIEGWDWILGSRAFVKSLEGEPYAAIVVDMIGDYDQNIYYEKNSNLYLSKQIWDSAADLGFSQWFIPEEKYGILDDHTPFLEKGIPAVDIIDFDYKYWHTTSDTSDKVSVESLKRVGDTLMHWLLQPLEAIHEN